jgi:hypothetical protein
MLNDLLASHAEVEADPVTVIDWDPPVQLSPGAVTVTLEWSTEELEEERRAFEQRVAEFLLLTADDF